MAFDSETKASLARFLEQRGLKARMVQLFGKIIRREDLGRGELTQSQHATYGKLVSDIEHAISEEWLTDEQLLELLDRAEVAGRQHVCVFRLPAKGVNAILNELSEPTESTESEMTLDDFWRLPEASTARVLRSERGVVVVKIVARRRYWRSELDPQESTENDQWIHRWAQEERSAVVIKCSRSSGILQIRVPPREHAQGETGVTVLGFVNEVLPRHYNVGRGTWYQKLTEFPITDAFNAIVRNRDDFVMRHDSAESDSAKSRMSKKGSIKALDDLRDDPMWQFEDGYSRKTMRGSWVKDDEPLYCHMNWDSVRISRDSTMDFARVFVPHLVSDTDIDHVIRRIKDHLP